ncbi:MAG TPA: tRNA uridine-5-carboxymethylaminomethyl(34) synthesis GTPase MnmE [Xanthomonadaceae bacterium]|nr:tRNA uridine-5-carboxymethylaminomethyl(34) synthesis GTPase MnmE [Xanthomonadaceae bacterium]
MNSQAAAETIVAIATGPAAGGIGIVRVSGPDAAAIAQAVTGRRPQPGRIAHRRFHDGDGSVLDDGVALFFAGPRSYTGEDVLELHGHGNPLLLRRLVARIVGLGARLARPGEFTERAYLNGKLDLAQAEAVADLIAAGSEAALRAARRSLQGEFSQQVEALTEVFTTLRVHVEAAIDFPEEEIDHLGDAALHGRLEAVTTQLRELLQAARRGQRLRDGLHVVIAGAPNAGKSSLLNALAGSERAIVTALPGTTRDLLRETVQLDGIELTLVDTAGLRGSQDPVEREGVRRARAELARADLVLAVLDARRGARERATLAAQLPDAVQVLWLYNKTDLPEAVAAPAQPDALPISALTGEGLDTLAARLRGCAGLQAAGEGSFSARARHVEALECAAAHLQAAAQRLQVERAGELAAEELRLAQHALGQIIGPVDADALLGRIFADFCIGK